MDKEQIPEAPITPLRGPNDFLDNSKPDPIVYLALVVSAFVIGVLIGILLVGGVL